MINDSFHLDIWANAGIEIAIMTTKSKSFTFNGPYTLFFIKTKYKLHY